MTLTKPQVKRRLTKWQRWRPFHAWRRGTSKDPVTIGLTSEQGWILLELISELPEGYRVSSAERSAINALRRENFKPLSDDENAAIYSGSIREPATIFNGHLSQTR